VTPYPLAALAALPALLQQHGCVNPQLWDKMSLVETRLPFSIALQQHCATLPDLPSLPDEVWVIIWEGQPNYRYHAVPTPPYPPSDMEILHEDIACRALLTEVKKSPTTKWTPKSHKKQPQRKL